jgi:hypothetical protein
MDRQQTSEQTEAQSQAAIQKLALDLLKERISGAHSTIPFAERLRDVVVAAATFQDSAHDLGMIKSDSGGLWIRSQSLGKFLHIEANSINRNLRQFGFERMKGANATTEIRRILPNLGLEARTWSLWMNKICTFNEFTTDDQLEQLTTYARIARTSPTIPKVRSKPPVNASSLRREGFDLSDEFWNEFFEP